MGERGALCILLMICIIGGAFLLGGLLFSRSVSTILQLVVAPFAKLEYPARLFIHQSRHSSVELITSSVYSDRILTKQFLFAREKEFVPLEHHV